MVKVIILSFVFSVLISCAPSISKPIDQSTEHSDQTASDLPDPDQASNTQKSLFTISQISSYFATDKLKQLYLVTPKNEVIKYDASGKEVFRYNNNFLDNLALVDATDPFNILLYYPDYLSVTTLDRTMNKTGTFDFSNLNLIRVRAVGASNDNNVWIYDEVAFKLKKINRNGTILRQSVDINLQLNYNPKPSFLIERENNIYVNDPNYGILIFNIFGEYESTLELKGLDRFQVFDNRLIYKKGRQVFSYHLQTFDKKEIILPVSIETSDEVLIQKNRLFIRKADRVEIYEI